VRPMRHARSAVLKGLLVHASSTGSLPTHGSSRSTLQTLLTPKRVVDGPGGGRHSATTAAAELACQRIVSAYRDRG
jgi:hypothetical protein